MFDRLQELGMNKSIRVIKKYPNRRLYDTANSGYITLADVKQMVLEHIDFQVIDAKSGDDLTRSILLQIILEEESAGLPMFSSEMLAQMIRFYGNALQGIMGNYLEQSAKLFMDMQQRMQDQTRGLFTAFPFTNFGTNQGPDEGEKKR